MVLRGLERVVLLEAAAAEVELIPVLQSVVLDTARSCAERQAASLATFAAPLRPRCTLCHNFPYLLKR